MATKKHKSVPRSNKVLVILLVILWLSIAFLLTITTERKTSPSLSLNQLDGKDLTAAGTGCRIEGCFNELCVNNIGKAPMYPCHQADYKEEFACYPKIGSCEKQKSGDCGWTQTPALLSCLNPELIPTPTPTPDGNKPTPPTSDNNNASRDANACRDQAPTAPADLYQINVTKSDATLYFTPAGKPYTRYIVQYGENRSMQHSANFEANDVTGALSADIHLLKSNTVYTFRVQPFNNCAPGAWSNSLTVKTTTGPTRIFYKNTSLEVTSAKKPTPTQLNTDKSESSTKLTPAATPTISDPPATVTPDYEPPQPQLNFFQQIWKFITDLFVR